MKRCNFFQGSPFFSIFFQIVPSWVGYWNPALSIQYIRKASTTCSGACEFWQWRLLLDVGCSIFSGIQSIERFSVIASEVKYNSHISFWIMAIHSNRSIRYSESLSNQNFHWVLTRIQHHLDMLTSDKKKTVLWGKRLQISAQVSTNIRPLEQFNHVLESRCRFHWAKSWSKKLIHRNAKTLSRQAFKEMLLSLIALQRQPDDDSKALYKMLQNNICYVIEYRETVLQMLMSYNETYNTK